MVIIRKHLATVLLTLASAGLSIASADSLSAPGDGGVPAFYNWTKAIPSKTGQLLRTEPLTGQQELASAQENIRLLYVSTDGIDNQTPVVVSGALFLPKGTPPRGGWPLMAWAHGTVGSADICAPSFAGRSDRDIRYLNYWLARGYAIVATDYQGLGTPGIHPYGLTRPLAYDVLDSIRAVQNGSFPLSKRVVVFGQSQGGRAAFATAVYAKSYAPDLDIVGVVATGTPYSTGQDLAAAEHVEAHRSVVPTFAYNVLRLTTAERLDSSFTPADYLSSRAIETFHLSQRACLHEIERDIVEKKLTYNDSFVRSPSAVFNNIERMAAYPTLNSDIPVFIGTGGKDRDVFVPSQVALVTNACKAGDRIEWHFYPALNHSETVNGSLVDSTRFVASAFAGHRLDGNCASSMADIARNFPPQQ
ncbi:MULTISPECIES: alpha/beta fold hydrolase [unclassified Caballeronia]|uniref:alpha/beta fold hydrolase n=1 Tax=unclassified Caballeronia TaxID=2646786 RepID=UPI00025BC324|nr:MULTISPECIES: alpha/beta fold hydrolase [unclassified Caballeronia]EKS70245.1 secretory lipase family protein [Burkholderia sp. SJ98]MCE4546483.1 alpha/beta fold hydrolase [Caballeronia sp. PC1]MCE4573043.1 alpha/beta fold hydrolase [Caballeronia sp. CLC5]